MRPGSVRSSGSASSTTRRKSSGASFSIASCRASTAEQYLLSRRTCRSWALSAADSQRGREVAVKVLRPGMLKVIDKDLELMHTMAVWLDRLSTDGKRLKPREVVAEFDKNLHDELDLVREASNATQLRRNMAGLNLVLIPEMIWEYCTRDVIVMERMHGIPISQVDVLRKEIGRAHV